MTLACQSDLACFRNDGHTGDHAYATPDTKPQPVSRPDTDRLAALLRAVRMLMDTDYDGTIREWRALDLALREYEAAGVTLDPQPDTASRALDVPIGVEEAIARGQAMLAASEAAADREITRLREEQARLALGAAFDRDALDAERAKSDQLREAAQNLVRNADSDVRRGGWLVPDKSLEMLRAALEAER